MGGDSRKEGEERGERRGMEWREKARQGREGSTSHAKFHPISD